MLGQHSLLVPMRPCHMYQLGLCWESRDLSTTCSAQLRWRQVDWSREGAGSLAESELVEGCEFFQCSMLGQLLCCHQGWHERIASCWGRRSHYSFPSSEIFRGCPSIVALVAPFHFHYQRQLECSDRGYWLGCLISSCLKLMPWAQLRDLAPNFFGVCMLYSLYFLLMI